MAEPYQLAYSSSWLYCRGPQKILKDLLRIPGAVKQEGCIAVPVSRAVFLALEAVATPESMSKEYREARAQWMTVSKEMRNDIFTTLLMGHKLNVPLLPHQEETVAFCHNKRGCLIASQPGTGKTRGALISAYLWRCQRVLVVCPLSLIPTWRKEWLLTWRDPRPFAFSTLDSVSVQERRTRLVAHGVTSACWPIIAAINPEVVAKLTDAIKTYDPDLIIIDESSRCKNEKAEVTKALIPLCDASKHVLLLNGTPFANRGAADIWAQLRMLGEEVVPESFWQFTSTYCNLDLLQVGARQIWSPSGCRDPIGLMQRIEAVYFRVPRAAVVQLPPTVYEVVELEMTPDQRYLYDAVEKDSTGVLGNPLSLDTARVSDIRLHQLAGGNRPEYDPFGEEANESDYVLHPIPGNPKLEWLKTYAREVLADNPSIRVVVWFRYLAELFQAVAALEEIVNIEGVWGETSNEAIEGIKASFNSLSSEGVQVIAAQQAKLCFGHNLPACSSMVYYSNGWSYLQRSQSEDRARRLNSEGGLTVFDLVMRKSIDEDILAALKRFEDFSSRMSVATVGG